MTLLRVTHTKAHARAAAKACRSFVPARVAVRASDRRVAQRTFAKDAATEPEKAKEPKKDAAKKEEAASDAKAEQSSSEEEEQMVAAERLLLACRAGDLEDATMLAEAVVAETEALAAAVEAAEAEKKATDATLNSLKDQYRRLQADFDNFRSRADKEKQKTASNVKKSVVQDLLPLIDNFEIASTAVKTETEGEEKIQKSYQGLYRQMVDTFRGMGLEAVPTEGTPFNPEVHDGIMREENDDVPDGTVLQELRKGFKFGDTLLRPAMVKVSFSDKPSEDSKSSSEGGKSSTEGSSEE